ncbi:MAG: PAS domain S-box protein [Bacteroidales bacterium]
MKSESDPYILIVDDIESNVELLETILRHLNANIIRAFSGKEALEKIRGKEIALALVDVHMPEMGGLELASHILSDKDRDLIPIIFITAYPCNDSELEKIYDTGVIDYIFKPLRPNLIINKVKVLLDLHRQKQKILESEKLYRILLNASPEGIIVMDTLSLIREISHATSEIFGLTKKEDFIGKNISALFPPDQQTKVQEVIQNTIHLGPVYDMEIEITRSDQTRTACEISLKLIIDNHQKPFALMAVIRDISRRKIIQQKMIHTERLASIGEMATGIAHEINQPLNIISLGLDNLLAEISKRNSVDTEYFDIKAKLIFNNISRITHIIDHIKTFSRAEHDFLPVEFDIHDVIGNAVSMIENQLRDSIISLELQLGENVQRITGNPNKFEQVILNLLLNSRDAIVEKKEDVKTGFNGLINIKTYADKYQLFIEVLDNGMGIQSTDLDKIMLPFHTTKKVGKGTGLGLSISFGIIRELNGNIEIDSEYSRWTKVIISLPFNTGDKVGLTSEKDQG